MGGASFERLRRIVVEVSAELAFLRLLTSRGVPFDTLGATPFTEPDRYDLDLGGRRCDLKSSLIYRKEDIRQLRRQPEKLLEASALVPLDEAESQRHGDEGLYLFVFATGLVTRGHQDIEKALSAAQPVYLIHELPPAWVRPASWQTLGRISLKSLSDQLIEMELGGQGPDRSFMSEHLRLAPGQTSSTQNDFYTLYYLQVSSLPGHSISVQSSGKHIQHLIQPADWGNIWVYGMEVILAGYMRRGEFAQRAVRLAPGSRTSQYASTRTHNLALPVAQLYPCEQLFQRVRKWKQNNF